MSKIPIRMPLVLKPFNKPDEPKKRSDHPTDTKLPLLTKKTLTISTKALEDLESQFVKNPTKNSISRLMSGALPLENQDQEPPAQIDPSVDDAENATAPSNVSRSSVKEAVSLVAALLKIESGLFNDSDVKNILLDEKESTALPPSMDSIESAVHRLIPKLEPAFKDFLMEIGKEAFEQEDIPTLRAVYVILMLGARHVRHYDFASSMMENHLFLGKPVEIKPERLLLDPYISSTHAWTVNTAFPAFVMHAFSTQEKSCEFPIKKLYEILTPELLDIQGTPSSSFSSKITLNIPCWGADPDLYFGTGRFYLVASCEGTLKFDEKGSCKSMELASIQFSMDDYYDWHPGLYAEGNDEVVAGIPDDWGAKLVENQVAFEFPVSSEWSDEDVVLQPDGQGWWTTNWKSQLLEAAIKRGEQTDFWDGKLPPPWEWWAYYD